jgi:Domain of unknown function (DUF4034)
MASTAQQPISLRNNPSDPDDPELAELSQQLQQGRLDGLRQYLARTRDERDWQDRIFVLGQVAPKASIGDLDAACEAEPNAADVFLIRCAYFAELACTMRGTGTCDQVTKERFSNSAECAKAAVADMKRSAELDKEDPTCFTLILRPLTIFSQREMMKQAFQTATALAPGLVPAHHAIVTALSQRWGGSHDASVGFARGAMTNAGPGSDMASCLFWAHNLVRTHYKAFDKDLRAEQLYRQNIEVRRELDEAFDKWIEPPYTARRASIKFLKHASAWYLAAKNNANLERAIALTNERLTVSRAPAARKPNSPASGSSANGRGGLLGWLTGTRGKR